MLKLDHSLAWNNMVILLDNIGKVQIATTAQVSLRSVCVTREHGRQAWNNSKGS